MLLLSTFLLSTFFSCGFMLPALSWFICFHFLCAEFLEETFAVVAWWSYIVLVSAYLRRLLLLHLF
jgi:hypothetical protein